MARRALRHGGRLRCRASRADRQIAEGATFPRRPHLVVIWVPKVACFSFLTSQVYFETQ